MRLGSTTQTNPEPLVNLPLANETVSQCEKHTNVILSRRRRISRSVPFAKTRSFGYRLRMTCVTVSGGEKEGVVCGSLMELHAPRDLFLAIFLARVALVCSR